MMEVVARSYISRLYVGSALALGPRPSSPPRGRPRGTWRGPPGAAWDAALLALQGFTEVRHGTFGATGLSFFFLKFSF